MAVERVNNSQINCLRSHLTQSYVMTESSAKSAAQLIYQGAKERIFPSIELVQVILTSWLFVLLKLLP